MTFIAVTNNLALKQKYENEFEINYYDVELLEILTIVRDMVHIGHEILTHPLSGSIKPNETPIKTIFVAKQKGELDLHSLSLIENAIEVYKKFAKIKIEYEGALDDFQTVDLSLAESALVGLMAF